MLLFVANLVFFISKCKCFIVFLYVQGVTDRLLVPGLGMTNEIPLGWSGIL